MKTPWMLKYRPKTIRETVLPSSLKSTFQAMVDKGEFPNLLLAGSAGIGKTTVALAMLEEMEYDVYFVNASMSGGIDSLRNEIQEFASTMSLEGRRKCVLLDEADQLTQTTQGALRAFMEEYGASCSFILTANFPGKIIKPISESRVTQIDFKIPAKEAPKLCREFLTRACTILDTEGVQYDKQIIAELIMRHFPDWRRVINELQRYSARGVIDTGILSQEASEIDELIKLIKDRKYTACRTWIAEQLDLDPQRIFRAFYDSASEKVDAASIPQLVIHIGTYSDRATRVADAEINLSAFVAEIMRDVEFK